MKTRYKIYNQGSPYFMTHTIVAWISVFTRRAYFDVVLEALKYCQDAKGLRLFAWVVMDNHLHLLAAGEEVSRTMKEFKSYTAREIIRLAQERGNDWLLGQFQFHKSGTKAGSNYQVWQEGFHPQEITSERMLRQKMEYIHHNPVRAGLVDKAEDWPYSSARNYLGLAGLLEIDRLEI
jgi:putative transposase